MELSQESICVICNCLGKRKTGSNIITFSDVATIRQCLQSSSLLEISHIETSAPKSADIAL